MKKFAAAAAILLAVILLVGCIPLNISITGPSATPKEIMRGTIDDNVYSSEYSDVTFTAPEGWVYATDDEIATLTGVSADMYKDAGVNFSKEVLAKQSIYDMLVQDPVTSSNVLIMYENLAMSIGGTKYNEEQYLNQMISVSNQAQVFDYEFGDITDQSIGAYAYKVLPAGLPENNCTQYYIVRKIDKYMLGIVITVFGDDKLSDILAYFS